MRIIFAGTPDVAVPSLQALAEAGHDVAAVLTRKDARVGRKGTITPSPVADAADSLGITVIKSNHLDKATVGAIQAVDADLGVVVAYGGLIPPALLVHPRQGWINLHFSDLPRWRGAAPVQRALMAGEQELGVTVFRLVEALDAGDVLTRDSLTVSPGTTSGEALKELATYGTDALLNAIHLLQEDPSAGEPQAGKATYAHKLSRSDGKLDVHASSQSLLAHWAGATPEPGAYVTVADSVLKITRLRQLTEAEIDRIESADLEGLSPGTAVIIHKIPVLVTRASGGAPRALVLDQVQPAGKGVMLGADWLRGRGGKAELR